MLHRLQVTGAHPGFFLGGGALVSCSTSTLINHIVFFFCRIPVVLENRRSSLYPFSFRGAVQKKITSVSDNLPTSTVL